MSQYKPVIGLEVHIELDTKSKMFCECPAAHFRTKPNSQTCPVCLGLPGALPHANQKAIEYTIKLGSVLGCKINKFSKFDRKHYFYPDLPKAYQISQYDLPFCEHGEFEFDFVNKKKKIRITRVHLEEDTGKLVHKNIDGQMISLIDFNRSGVPLLEMVTEPDFTSAEEVVAFMKELQLVVRYLGISGADMEKGSMRIEANVSVAESSSDKLPDFKVELKNINSFRFMENAVNAEIRRMTQILQEGGKVKQETRGYDEDKDETFSQRSKEEAKDYRYFPEPDIPPVRFSDTQISELTSQIPALPEDYRNKFIEDYNLPENYVEVLVSDKLRADFFETAAKIARELGLRPKMVANQMVNQQLDHEFEDPKEMVLKIKSDTQIDTVGEEKVHQVIDKVIVENPDPVNEYKGGKHQVIGFLIGQVMQGLKGKGDPKMVKKLLQEKLN